MERMIVSNAILLGETKRLLKEGKKVTIKVKGNSMLPFLHGDRDSVELIPTENYQHGDIVLAEVKEDHYVLHRILSMDGNEPEAKVILMGDGNIKGVETCKVKDLIGKVACIYKKNKQIDPNTDEERKKAEIWLRLRPIRRWILAIYKRVYRL